ncbi:MAG: radical SAM protein [Deltaproteobacteria bacterium]|nr:radical SAM protein [Deltaproteobacteria bacterium]
MKDVLLIYPPVNFIGDRPFVMHLDSPPLGLVYLRAYVHRFSKDYRVHWIDAGGDRLTLEDIRQKIVSVRPWVIGMTLLTSQLQGAMDIVKMIREKISRDIPIFAGGPHVTADPTFIDRHPGCFDYGIVGEAEGTFLHALDQLARGEPLPRILEGEPLMDLEVFPIPERYRFRRENYWKRQHVAGTRSCPYHCYFCSNPVGTRGRKMRFASNRRVIDEIKYNYDFYKGVIKWLDENFTLDHDRVMEFCHMVKKEDLRLHYFVFSRIDTVNELMLKTMKESGLDNLACGIEAGDERIRNDVVNKGGVTNAMIYQVDEWCQKYDINFSAYFMLGHPTENERTIKATRDLIFDLHLHQLSLTIPTPYPGSRLFEIAESEGIISPSIVDRFARKEFGEGFWGTYPVYVSQDLEIDYVVSELKDIYRKFYYDPQRVASIVKEQFTSWDDVVMGGRYIKSLLKGASYQRDYSGYRGYFKRIGLERT